MCLVLPTMYAAAAACLLCMCHVDCGHALRSHCDNHMTGTYSVGWHELSYAFLSEYTTENMLKLRAQSIAYIIFCSELQRVAGRVSVRHVKESRKNQR